MKKIVYSAFIALGVLFASCDYVSNPYPVKNGNISSDTSTCIATFPTVSAHIKKVLLEDYTGHTCANCPRAARDIHAIDSTYPGKTVALAVHVGYGLSGAAAPSPNFYSAAPGSFMDDYRTTIGNTYDGVFTIYNFGLPGVMVNRTNYNATTLTHIRDYRFFTPYVDSIILHETSVVDLQINLNYDASTRKMCCAIRDSFLVGVTGNFKLVALLTQDNISGWQDDIDANPNEVSNYVFNHMLRDAITPTGAWGEPLIGSSASVGLTQIRHFAYTIPGSFNNIPCTPANCHIVAFIYNTATYEIIQSEIASIP